jgi:hypothetical protein
LGTHSCWLCWSCATSTCSLTRRLIAAPNRFINVSSSWHTTKAGVFMYLWCTYSWVGKTRDCIGMLSIKS